jgi:hypothetical protein
VGILTSCVACSVAIAMPALRMAHSAAQEAMATSTLKSAIFSAQVQFQAAAQVDQDGNGTGEYGTLDELKAAPGTPAGQVRTLAQIGYECRIFLPLARDRATQERTEKPSKEGIALQERHFVCYAWPTAAKHGGHILAITSAGTVFAQEIPSGTVPAAPEWNALFGGGDWTAKPGWPAYSERAKKSSPFLHD